MARLDAGAVGQMSELERGLDRLCEHIAYASRAVDGMLGGHGAQGLSNEALLERELPLVVEALPYWARLYERVIDSERGKRLSAALEDIEGPAQQLLSPARRPQLGSLDEASALSPAADDRPSLGL